MAAAPVLRGIGRLRPEAGLAVTISEAPGRWEATLAAVSTPVATDRS